MYKTIRRNWLKKQIELGKVEAKCNYSYTDDYAFDNAYGFGKTDWMPARIRSPKFEPRMMPAGFERDVCVDDDRKDGFMNFDDCDFTGKAGMAYWKDESTIRLSVHSNLSYSLRIKA